MTVKWNDSKPFVLDIAGAQNGTEQSQSPLHIGISHDVVAVSIPADKEGDTIKAIAEGLKHILGIDIAATLKQKGHHPQS